MTTAISNMDGSPCKECLITATCTRSFIYNSACEKYKEYVNKMVDNLLESRRKKRNEDQVWIHNK